MKCLLLILALVAALLPSTRGLSCLPCREVTCELPAAVKRCPWGLVLDMCGCCFVCGKGPGETCGGQWAWHGRCGHTLDCLKPHEVPGSDREHDRAAVGGGNALALLNMEEPARCYRQRDSVADSISTFFAWFSSLFRNGPRDD
ncbi:single insulin-like growth factor-binding domain protein-2 isoform X1 [Portunus trituberculatus]|uniref:single insulin-like growth factor-binding domain protein-2 isoform X1 n=1 Tax=Portunus trituberculatus TaxID=210409 RepID=UPI001E1CF50E|nr:single insulin-like growth factor-binding domain protein-2 isoform X1 [Portunus trituberculatus]